ncbi:electron transport complex subunit RsxE [Uliginosibacterium gangwonense]|uniref:electron transport complex subunit RsxE n=1 Tax=Uliginosibacterium gangwonense TaxID=392736 RepID=UPI00037F2BAA|nr:electron transport complex subunit E [Uliginosibacterium gangwonense]
MSQKLSEVAWNGIWKQNTGLVQMLGMCPILAVSTSIVNGVSLGLATVVVMALSNGVVSALRQFIPYEIRIPVFILIIAALVTILDLAMNAWMHEIYLVLGIYIPLIVTNCIVLARVEAFAAKNGVVASTLDGAAMGFGLTLVLAVLGGVREFVGNGALLNGIDSVISGASPIQILPADYPGFLIAILPPGAFITLACLIATKNWQQARKAKAVPTPTQGGELASATH